MENITITKNNFREIRKKNGFSIQDVADRSKLSPATVNNFERSRNKYTDINARDYNDKCMINALSELVSEKENIVMKTEYIPVITTTTKKATKKCPISSRTDINYFEFIKNLNKYLKLNSITKKEFAEMCNIRQTMLTATYNSKVLSVKLLKRLCDATGWTEEEIRTGSFVTGGSTKTNKEDKEMSYVPTEKSVKAGLVPDVKETVIKASHPSVLPISDNPIIVTNKTEEEKNISYTFKDGSYYMEYDQVVTSHVLLKISKKDFMEKVQ